MYQKIKSLFLKKLPHTILDDPRLSAIKRLRKEHDYASAARICRSILLSDPVNIAAQNILQDLEGHLSHRHIRYNFMVLCGLITVLLIAILIMSHQITADLGTRKLQVNSLIQEFGELNEGKLENAALSKVQNLEIQEIQEKIALLSQKIELLNSTQVVTLTNTQKELQQAQQELEQIRKIATEKDKKIRTLSQKKPEVSASPKVGVLLPLQDEFLDILILGTNGSLSDTIITASINPTLRTITLISYPRDLLVNGRKINEIYGKFGIEKIAEAITELSGIIVERYVVINLQAFIDIIDTLGGIDINVPKALTDHLYPGPNYTYSTFSITAGQHHLDGITTLKYARSRKSTSDFDRSKRQQQVIEAVIQKLKSQDIFSDLEKSYQILTQLASQINTNIDAIKAISYYQDYKDYTLEQGNVLTTANYLYSTHNDRGQYILLSRTGDFSEIKAYIHNLIFQ